MAGWRTKPTIIKSKKEFYKALKVQEGDATMYHIVA